MIFKDYARRYYENNLSVIPIAKNSKIPLIRGWQEFSQRLPTEDEIQLWEDQFPDANIGLVLGKASQILAVDIDTDYTQTKRYCQQSPYERIGKKGFVRFFKWSEKAKNTNDNSKCAEILANNRQVILPPSIHPDTKRQYEWSSFLDLAMLDRENLPDFDQNLFDQLPIVPNEERPETRRTDTAALSSSGRNNKLKDIVTAMRARGESEEKIVQEIYDQDKIHHQPRLFTDPSEKYYAENEDDAKMNAWRFVSSITTMLIDKKLATPSNKYKIEFTNQNLYTFMAPPNLENPFVDWFASITKKVSKSDIKILSYGGAISTLATIASNRFSLNDTWPNMYVLNIAPSGSGKSIPEKIIKDLLGHTDLIGSGNYQSSSAMIKSLEKKKEKLDIIDEASSLFSKMSNGDIWQSSLVEDLCQLFSNSSNVYLGKDAAKDENSFKKIANPCLNILASTTPAGLINSVNHQIGQMGLLPRFIYFYQHDVGEWSDAMSMNDKEILSQLDIMRQMIALFIQEFPIQKSSSFDYRILENSPERRVEPRRLELSNEARAVLSEFDRACFEENKAQEMDQMTAFISRKSELVQKLCVCLTVGEMITGINNGVVTEKIAKKSIELINFTLHNMSPLLGEITGGSVREKKVQRIIGTIKANHKIDRRTLKRKTQWASSRELDEILTDLVDMGILMMWQESTGSKPRTFYAIADK